MVVTFHPTLFTLRIIFRKPPHMGKGLKIPREPYMCALYLITGHITLKCLCLCLSTPPPLIVFFIFVLQHLAQCLEQNKLLLSKCLLN